MKILHLTLKKRWFDLILSGEKKEEYREIKEYWAKRLSHDQELNNLKSFDFIEFTNGYSKMARKMVVEFKGMEMGKGKAEWGATKDEFYFVIKLGEITDTKYCEKAA